MLKEINYTISVALDVMSTDFADYKTNKDYCLDSIIHNAKVILKAAEFQKEWNNSYREPYEDYKEDCPEYFENTLQELPKMYRLDYDDHSTSFIYEEEVSPDLGFTSEDIEIITRLPISKSYRVDMECLVTRVK